MEKAIALKWGTWKDSEAIYDCTKLCRNAKLARRRYDLQALWILISVKTSILLTMLFTLL